MLRAGKLGKRGGVMRQRLITGALVTCLGGFSVGACVFTADWIRCMVSAGGEVCRESRDMAAGAWAGLATNALALATNIMNEES
jgi:hypothetical protein